MRPTTTSLHSVPLTSTAATSIPRTVSSSRSSSGLSSTSTYSASQESGTRTSATLVELGQEAQVSAHQQPQVRDAVAQERDPIQAHAPRVALVLVRVQAAIAQDRGMHHPCAQH